MSNGTLYTSGVKRKYNPSSFELIFYFSNEEVYNQTIDININDEFKCYLALTDVIKVTPVMYISMLPPKCTYNFSSFLITEGFLLPGLDIDSTGVITGYLSEYINNDDYPIKFTFTGEYGYIVSNISVIFQVIPINSVPLGISMRIGPENQGSVKFDLHYKYIINGYYYTISKSISELSYSCFNCSETNLRFEHVYILFSSIFHARLDGEYTFTVIYDDNVRIYFGDMLVKKKETAMWNEYAVYKVSLTKGYYPIRFLCYSDAGLQGIEGKYRTPDGVEKIISSSIDFYMDIQPIQYFEYPEYHIYHSNTYTIDLIPEVFGNFLEYEIESDSGDILTCNGGEIEGTINSERSIITITGKIGDIISYSKKIYTYKIYSNCVSNLLYAYYYIIDDNICPSSYTYFNDLTPRIKKIISISKVKIIDDTYLPDDLNIDFSEAFGVLYSGKWKSDKESNTITLKTPGGLYFNMINTIIKSDCNKGENVITFELTQGNIQDVNISFWKTIDYEQYSFEISRENDPITAFCINDFYISYKTYVAEYEMNKLIEDNSLIYNCNGCESGCEYVIYPDLPNGLIINKNDGKISGTPNEIIPMTEYTVTCNKNNVFNFNVKLTIKVIPNNFKISYPDTNVTIGNSVSIIPDIINPNYIISFEFKESMSEEFQIDRISGVIKVSPKYSENKDVEVKYKTRRNEEIIISFHINILGCDNGYTSFYLLYTSYDPLFSIEISNNDDKNKKYYLNSNHLSYEQYYYSFCVSPTDTLLFQIKNSGKYGPEYELGFGKYIYTHSIVGQNDYISFKFTTPSNDKPLVRYFSNVIETLTYTNFYISPYIINGATSLNSSDLLNTLKFDDKTGELSGYIENEGKTTVFIQATNDIGISTITTLTIITKDKCDKESDILYKTKYEISNNVNVNHTLTLTYGSEIILYNLVLLQNTHTYYHSFCKPKGSLTIIFTRSSIDSTDTTELDIYRNNIQLKKITFTTGRDSLTDTIISKILYKDENYCKLKNFENNWNMNYYDNSDNCDIISTPSLKYTSVTYLRKIIYLDDIPSDIKYIRGNIKYRSGVIIYINNKQIYRRNMPEITEVIDSNTEGDNCFTSNKNYEFRIPSYVINEGVVYLGIELHTCDNSEYTFELELDYSFNVYSLDCSLDDINVVSSSGNSCGLFTSKNEITVMIYSDNIASYIDRYKIYTSDNKDSDIDNWELYGVTDVNYKTEFDIMSNKKVLLDTIINGNLPIERNSYKEFTFDSEYFLSFEGYILKATKARASDSEISFKNFVVDFNNNLYCESDGTWPNCRKGQTCFISCGSGYDGSKGRYCNLNNQWDTNIINNCIINEISSFIYTPVLFIAYTNYYSETIPDKNLISYSIDKELPLGLNFNSETGIINGSPYERISMTQYIITGNYYSSNGQLSSYSTKIFIQIDDPLCISNNLPSDCSATTVTYEELIFYTMIDVKYIPSINGLVNIWEISDNPSGININKFTGEIYGKVNSDANNGKLKISFDRKESEFSYTIEKGIYII